MFGLPGVRQPGCCELASSLRAVEKKDVRAPGRGTFAAPGAPDAALPACKPAWRFRVPLSAATELSIRASAFSFAIFPPTPGCLPMWVCRRPGSKLSGQREVNSEQGRAGCDLG